MFRKNLIIGFLIMALTVQQLLTPVSIMAESSLDVIETAPETTAAVETQEEETKETETETQAAEESEEESTPETGDVTETTPAETEEEYDIQPEEPETETETAEDPLPVEEAESEAETTPTEAEAVEETVPEEADVPASESETVPDETEESAPEERTIECRERNNYKVSVTYGVDAGIPMDAVLDVKKIEETDKQFDPYFSKTDSILRDTDIQYIKLLDISIVDKDDPSVKYQPSSSVSVQIAIDDNQSLNSVPFQVVHFGKRVECLDSNTENETVSFTTDGFSAYAIVQGPAAVSSGWERVTTMEQFAELASTGLSLGHQNGFYMTNEQYTVSGSRTGIRKTKPAKNTPPAEAAKYYFEPAGGTNQYYAYCFDNNGNRKYVRNTGNNSLSLTDAANKTAFTVSMDATGKFQFTANGYYWNMQGGDNGNGFAAYNSANDANSFLLIWKSNEIESEPYDLDGAVYALINYSGGTAGKGLLAEEINGNALQSVLMTIVSNKNDAEDKLYIPKDSDISMWTFEWVEDFYYYISADVNGSTKYLNITASSVSLSDTPVAIRVQAGSDTMSGKISLLADGKYVGYSGNMDDGFVTANNASGSNCWFNLAELSDVTQDYLVTYSASKVSVSDREKVTNGSRVILYTRVWNNTSKKYEFFAVDHEGNLTQVYESGDSIQWIGTAINTLLWGFTEYYYEGTNTPNNYYELRNEYSGKYLSPKLGAESVMSDSTIGINLNGRRYMDYYTTILAWDDSNYAYVGLKTAGDHIVAAPMAQAGDFYFAIMEDIPVTDNPTVVPTIDHTQYGITMKLVDFNGNNGQNAFLGSSSGGAGAPPTQGLLSTDIKSDGYPTAAGGSLGTLFAGAQEVNHLFIESTYQGTGYYEFDSTQNFATLQSDGNFKVYKELATNDTSSKPSLKHGQFLPYNDITPGLFASVNGENLYDAELRELSDLDPRKHEHLYLIRNTNYHFGVEIEATFAQTANGLDAWGHDIIYNFTGDDDFWLYVDGELIIDLGGIHSALPGSVNYSTGEVSVNGIRTTLYDTFRSNYVSRGMTENEIAAKLDEIFEEKEDERGNTYYTFKDYTSHTMRIFFMERGAGASNLHMKFNLASVKPGRITLSKKISGIDKPDYRLAEYGYQIYYSTSENGPYYRLNQQTSTSSQINVTYNNSNAPVKFLSTFTPAGSNGQYEDVYFLTPNQTAVISIPDTAIAYYIVECGVNTQVYDVVTANDIVLEGIVSGENRKDYAIEPSRVADRPKVTFDNHISDNSARTLTITKKLYDINDNEITDDPTGFDFRLYLDNEYASDPEPANMQEYLVKNRLGEYCRWDSTTQNFASLGKDTYEDLTESEITSATFQTSPNGAISKIPSGYSIEVRGLLVGTKFRVIEIPNEIPKGYSLIEYRRVGGSYIVEEGDTVNSGIIRDMESPAVEIRNRRGFGLTANKVWTDASFMASHDDIYTAVYVNNVLLPDSVRRIRHPDTQVYYYWDSLAPGSTLGDYQIAEVELAGNNITVDSSTGVVSGYTAITKKSSGDSITVGGVSKDSNTSVNYRYAVTYATGTASGHAHNLRTDTITNTRQGIRLVKTDWNGNPLSGAEFALSDENGNLTGNGVYTSDGNGLITIAYINPGSVYYLAETKAPAGYQSCETPLGFRMLSNGIVELTQSESGFHSVTQSASDGMPVITVKNKACDLKAVKQEESGEPSSRKLGGAHFDLYREVTINGITLMDFNPMTGYTDLISADTTGVIQGITEALPPGVYYLKETIAPSGYDLDPKPIRFAITETGYVSMDQTDNASFFETNENGVVHYVITISNVRAATAPTGIKLGRIYYIFLIAAGLLLLMKGDLFRRFLR